MFSRSEKTEEATEVMTEPSGQRSPMVLAALAGLLAIAGAFLLVWYLNNGRDDVAEPGSVESSEVADESTRQVLVVTRTIPRNTSVRELIDAPTVYLSAKAVPEEFIAASAITSVAELQELAGLVLASEAIAGEQLLRGRFRDPSDFDSPVETTFIEDASGIETPAGHHAVVFELPSTRAMGGNIRAGELVTIIAAFRVSPPNSDTFDASVVVLNSVELLNIQGSVEVAGQISSDANQIGVANRGSYVITAAVTPEELTDLTYAITYGEITLATALEGLDNEEGPRAVTTLQQILGDDGVWLEETEDGNIVSLIDRFPAPDDAVGQSIELELPDEEEDATPPEPEEDTLTQDDGSEEPAGDS